MLLSTDSIKILILDDEFAICETIHDMLQDISPYPIQTKLCQSSLQAERYLAENIVHIVITDFSMPAKMGDLFLYDAQKLYPWIRFVVMTGYVKLNLILSCLRSGMDGFLLKPIESQNLAQIVRPSLDIIHNWHVLFQDAGREELSE